tara:strand:+ start:255 stop:1217 length:963 start_codon:yes stop_codon:yes gene_type:complete
MNNLSNGPLNNNLEDEINLGELLYALWKNKFYIGAITSIFALISIVYALMLPNIYMSKAIMLSVESSSGGMSSMMGQYSGIAGLAGITLPSESTSRSQEAIARIQSFEFFSNHFLPLIKLENLLAVKKWNQASNILVYDKSKFNSTLGQWVQKARPPQSIIPSSQVAYETYKQIISIGENKKTSFVTLSVEHESPFIAQQWVEIIINKIDDVMRDEDKRKAMKSVNYLNSLTPTINYEEIKKALSSLQQEQMKKLMMVEASENYIFKILEPPIVPEMKSTPLRSLIVIIASLLGMMFGSLITLALHYSKKSSEHNESNSQ